MASRILIRIFVGFENTRNRLGIDLFACLSLDRVQTKNERVIRA